MLSLAHLQRPAFLQHPAFPVRLACAAAVAVPLLCAPPGLLAQRGGGGGGRGSMGGMSGGYGGAGFGGAHGDMSSNAPEASRTAGGAHGALQLGPPGRWWDDKHFAKELQLRPEQQRHMDATFETNRGPLLRRFEDLQGEQSRMESLVRAKSLDEGALFAQIDRIAQARAELEKANTHLLLQIRGEMDADQIARLEQHH